jgi:ABC-2 type transport system permease protein
VAYRAEMLIWMLTMTMPLVSLALWSAVAAGAPVGRFGQKEFAAYFLATLVVRQLSGSWVVWELIQDIKSGTLSARLLKPIHPLIAYSAENLGAIPMRALLAAPLAIFLLFARGAHLPREPLLLGAFALSLFGAWLTTFFVMALIGTLSFFIESSSSVFEIWLASFMLLSGYLLPLELFPPWVRDAAELLPFRYMLGFPVELLIGIVPRDRLLPNFIMQWSYVGITGVAALIGWRAGVRRFGAYGG